MAHDELGSVRDILAAFAPPPAHHQLDLQKSPAEGGALNLRSRSSTSHRSDLSPSGSKGGCSCGRSHPPIRPRKRKLRADDGELHPSTRDFARRHNYRLSRGEALNYAGDCHEPVRVNRQLDVTHLKPEMLVRCHRCPACMGNRMRYWAAAAYYETVQATERGQRTWFGTLTLRPQEQARLAEQALEKQMMNEVKTAVPEWWNETEPFEYFCKKRQRQVTGQSYVCDRRFELVVQELKREIQLYFDRLRAAGHKFRYLVVFEKHKTGLPHVHWLLHETTEPITKRELQKRWKLGNTRVNVVGGKSNASKGPREAAFYVAKYLNKGPATGRQMASQRYRPAKRA